MLVALDIEISGRSEFLGERQLSRNSADMQLFLGRRTYDAAEDIKLVKYSCNDDVRRKFLNSKLTTFLGGQVNRSKIDERTRELRVPVILSLGGCCNAFATPQTPLEPTTKRRSAFCGTFASSSRAFIRIPTPTQSSSNRIAPATAP